MKKVTAMTRRLLPVLGGLVGGLVLALALAVSCTSPGEEGRGGQSGQRSITRLPRPGPELGEHLMHALALAQNHHRKADVLLKEARVDEAIASVRQILSIQFPAGSPEGEDITLDARARLAKLLVTRGALDEAMTVVDQGLAGARRSSFFLANLHSVRGEVLEARAVLIADRDKRAAADTRRQAIASFDRAIAMEKALLDQLAGEEVE